QGMLSAWWDPFDGKEYKAGGAKLDLDLAPYESRIVVFSKQATLAPPLPTGAETTALDLSTGWKLTFPGGQPIDLQKLEPWLDLPDRKFYSGQATYEKT